MDSGSAGADECLAAGAGGGTGGVDVVDEENVAVFDLALSWFAGNEKSATKVVAALFGSESGLAFRSPATTEGPRGELKPYLRPAAAEAAGEGGGEQFGLVESARAFAAAMERDGYDEQRRGQVGDREEAGGEELGEVSGHWLDAVVLEELDECAEMVVVEAVCDGELERRRGEAADAAER